MSTDVSKRETDSANTTVSRFQESQRAFVYMMRRNPLYAVSIGFIGVYLTFSLVMAVDPSIIGYNPLQLHLQNILKPPSWANPFGTDILGKSLFLEVLYGAPVDAGIALSIVSIAIIIGTLTGSIAGYYGGKINEIVMRITDIFLAFPGFILAVAIAAALGPGLINALVALSAVWWPVYTRLARAQTLSIKQHHFVLAARASGVSSIRIVISHIIPNAFSPILAYATADLGNAIILFSVLGYLGLGAQPPNIDIGRIVYDGQNYIQTAPWYSVLPGVSLFVIVMSFALVGDFLRDYLDPRMRT
jgi:peptide/nickel transport system permease protein